MNIVIRPFAENDAAAFASAANHSLDTLIPWMEWAHLLGGAGIRYQTGAEIPAALGYWVRSSEQRKGINRSAVKWLVELGVLPAGYRCH